MGSGERFWILAAWTVRYAESVIPREMVENLRMPAGDFLAITQDDNAIIVKPKRIMDADNKLSPSGET